MLYEPTTLATVARLIGECLADDYGIDAEPLFAELDIDQRKFTKPGARVSFAKMSELWSKAISATDDHWFGFAVGFDGSILDCSIRLASSIRKTTIIGCCIRIVVRFCRSGCINQSN